MLIAMVLGSVLAILLGGDANGIQTVGDIPSNLPPFRIPDFTLKICNIKFWGNGIGITGFD